MEEVEQEARDRFPVELHLELIDSASAKPTAVLIRCGSRSIPLAALDDLEDPRERRSKAEKWAEKFPPAMYALDLGIGTDPEVSARIEQAKVNLLAGEMKDRIVKERFHSPTVEDLKAYYERFQDRVRSPRKTSGGSMQFQILYPVGADIRTRYEATMEAKRRAERIRSRFEQGEGFGTLAASLEDPDEAQTFALGESHGALFDVHTANLHPGEMSGPVEWGEAWHLFYLEELDPGRPLSFEEGYDMVVEHFLADREATLERELIDEIASDLGLEIREEAVAAYLAPFRKPEPGKP
jgi:hypothetical protein